MAERGVERAGLAAGGDRLLYLTDDRLRRGIETLFFAYRAFTADPDRVLAEYGLGRAHHRALHFVGRHPDIPVAELLAILQVSKQSLSRVLRDLVARGLVVKRVGEADRRNRLLSLTETGQELDRTLSEIQRARVRRAFRAAGADAVDGFHRVLENLVDEEDRSFVSQIIRTGRVR